LAPRKTVPVLALASSFFVSVVAVVSVVSVVAVSVIADFAFYMILYDFI
jgi:hypothetical protein